MIPVRIDEVESVPLPQPHFPSVKKHGIGLISGIREDKEADALSVGHQNPA